MKHWKILIVLFLIGGGIFVFRSCKKTTYTNFPPRATGDWVAFGDSLTSGFGASEGNDYPTLLGKKLNRKIINQGVPGETTAGALNRLDQSIQLKPRVVLLCLGGNDGLQQLPVEQTFSNLATLVDGLQQTGSFVVLIGVRSASISDRYSRAFKKLAKEKHVLYVPDILGGILGTPRLMSDYIHPNDAGYQAIAERLEKILTPLLPNL